jgi:hypothetical protein
MHSDEDAGTIQFMDAEFFAGFGVDVVGESQTLDGSFAVRGGLRVDAAVTELTAAGLRVERLAPGQLAVFNGERVATLTWPWTLSDRARAAVVAELIVTGEVAAPAGYDASTSLPSARLLEVGIPEVSDEGFVSTAATLLADRLAGHDGDVAEYLVAAALHAEPPLFDLARLLHRA